MSKKTSDILAAALSGATRDTPRPATAGDPQPRSFMASFMRSENAGILARLEELEAKFGGGAYPTRLIEPASVQRGTRANRLAAAFDEKKDPRFASLKASIKEAGGNAVAILVRPIEDGYEIVFGERRLRACEQLGLQVLATIADLSDEEALLLQYRENTERKDISVLEFANQIASWFPEADRGSRDAIAKQLGVTPSHLSRLRLIATLPPALSAVHPDPFGIAHHDALAMARLYRDDRGVFEARLGALPAHTLGGAAATRLLLTGDINPPAPQAPKSAPGSLSFRLPAMPAAKHRRFIAEFRKLADEFGLGLPDDFPT